MAEGGPVPAGGDGDDQIGAILDACRERLEGIYGRPVRIDVTFRDQPSSGAPSKREEARQHIENLRRHEERVKELHERIHGPSSGAPEGERQRVVLYDCAHNNARYAEPCDRCPVEGEGQPEAWQDGFNAGVESVLGEGQLTAEEAEAVAGKRSKREEWCNCARHRGIRKLRALSRESRA